MGSEISKKDITRLGFRWSLQASFNYERMQAGGFTWAMLPILKKIYKDNKPGLSAAMKDNLEFTNTHPNLVGFLMGLLISMEEKGGQTATPLKASKWHCLAQSPGLAMRFSGLLCCRLWREFAHHLPARETCWGRLFIFRRLPAYLFPARRLDPRRLFSRREGDR